MKNRENVYGTVVPNRGSCCGTTYQAHSRNIAVFLIVINLLEVILPLVIDKEEHTGCGIPPLEIPLLIRGGIGIGFSILLLCGTINKNKGCLMAWLIYTIIQVLTSYTILVISATTSFNFRVNSFQLYILIVMSINVLVLIPFWFVVIRFYNETRKNEGMVENPRDF